MKFKEWIKQNRQNRPQTERNAAHLSWEYVELLMEKSYKAGYIDANTELLTMLDELEAKEGV